MENELKKLVHVPSRIGRELQRYHLGHRQVVGCIPYRLVNNLSSSKVLEVLMVSSQKGDAMLFPKGGWENDESKQEAALRESLEEAGVIGSIQSELGQWTYKSKNQDTLHDGYMFPLLVEEELDYWPEKDFRQRKWVMVGEAKQLCPHLWMTEALESLVQRLEKLHAIDASSTLCFPQAVSWVYYLQNPCSPQAESRVSSNTKTIPKNSDEGEIIDHFSESLNSQLRNAKNATLGCRNLSSYLHRLLNCRFSLLLPNNTSNRETTVLLDRSNRKGLSENFSIDSTIPSCYLREVMVEQK